MGFKEVLRGLAKAAVVTMMGAAMLVGCSSDDGDQANSDAGTNETTVSTVVDEPDSTDEGPSSSTTSTEPSSSTTSTLQDEPTEPAIPADLTSWTWVRREAGEVGLPEDGEAFEVTAVSLGDGLVVMSGYRQRSGDADGFVEAPVIWTSADGSSWSSVDTTGAEPGEGLYSVAHGSAGFVAVGEVTVDAIGATPLGTGVVWISADGQSWTRQAPEEWASFVPRSVTPMADGGYLAAGATGRFQASVWRSADGVTWTQVAVFDESGGINLQEVAGGSRGYLAVGGRGESEDNRAFVAWSVDGLSWEDVSADEEVFPMSSSALEALVVGDGFVVAGSEYIPDIRASLWTSPDAAIWQRWAVPATDSIVYVGDMVVVPGSDTILLTGALADAEQPWMESGAFWQVSKVDGTPTPELLDLSEVPLGVGVWNVAASDTQVVAVGRDGGDTTNRRDIVVWTATTE